MCFGRAGFLSPLPANPQRIGTTSRSPSILAAGDHRIIVVVDDLDRLIPSEMRAVFSMVKSLGDLPHVLYVLSFDETVVHKALKDSSEKIDPDFLEKIVQVSLKLPPPWRHELRGLFFKRLDAVIGEATPVDAERWRRVYLGAIDPYLETPRDVTRLINTLQVIWPNVAGDVDLTDLVAITALQLFEPDVYALIRDEIEVITRAEYRFEDDAAFAKRMEPNFAKKPEDAKEAMAMLFPRLAKVWKTFGEDGTYYITQKEQRRICTAEYHRNYFVFGRDPRRLSRGQVEQIVLSDNPAPVLSAMLKRLGEDPSAGSPSRIAISLEQLGDAVYAKPILTPALTKAILDHSDDLIRREDIVWEFFVTKNDRRLRTLIELGLNKLDKPQRSALLNVLVDHPSGLQLRSAIVEGDAIGHGYFRGAKKHESELYFSSDEIESAALKISDQIALACADGTIWKAPTPIRLIFAWSRMASHEVVKAWFKTVLENEEWVLKLGADLPEISYQSGGRSGSRVLSTFNRSRFEPIFDIDALVSRLERMAVANADASRILQQLQQAERAEQE